MDDSIDKITKVISAFQQEQASALASTKNALCLSCGRGDANFLPPMTQVQGVDGNYYKTLSIDKRMPGNISSKENYDYGYEVFTRNHMVEEHNVKLHEPAEEFYNAPRAKKNRPLSAAPIPRKKLPSFKTKTRSRKDGTGISINSKKSKK